MSLGKGAIMSISTKQKINTKSSTEAEIVGVDDTLPFNVWCRNFLLEQGYHSNGNNPMNLSTLDTQTYYIKTTQVPLS